MCKIVAIVKTLIHAREYLIINSCIIMYIACNNIAMDKVNAKAYFVAL